MQATQLLVRSGLESLLNKRGGFAVVGSADLDLMTWPDIDLYMLAPPDSPSDFLTLLPPFEQSCHETGLALVKVSYNNEYLRPDNAYGEGLYLGLRLLVDSVLWKIDLWAWSRLTLARKLEEHRILAEKLANADRDLILTIKQAVQDRPEYRGAFTSLHVYDFVLSRAGGSLADFDAWLLKSARAV